MKESTVPQPAGFMEDFIDIFYAPAAVFARRREASPWPPLLVITGLFALLTYVSLTLLAPMWDAEFSRGAAAAMRDNPGLTAEQVQQGRGFARIGILFAAVFGVPVVVLVMGLVLWLVGKLFDAEQALRAAFLVIVFSFMPRVIELVLQILQGLVLDVNTLTSRYAVSLSPARFTDLATTPPVMLGLLERLGPFVLWSYVIVAIGLKVTGGIDGRKAALAAAFLWLLGSVPAMLQGLGGR